MKYQELTCIVCPRSCLLRVVMSNEKIVVEGANCQRGVEYAEEEVSNPKRIVFTVIPVEGGDPPVVSVKTTKPIPKLAIRELVTRLLNVKLKAPVLEGQIVLKNFHGADVVVTRRSLPTRSRHNS
ncbi:MAG: DUF1667 domain-containing protein [Candidatus Nezhaarchaeales archaeon]|nr:MAG: molybdopterin oxidoreductase [Candidatus Nezhaarchaeota archaeon WYZ-LMO7]